jgi:hypothetical protein
MNASFKHSFYGNAIFNYAFLRPLFQGAIRAYNKALVCVVIMQQLCFLQTGFFHDIVNYRNPCAFKMSVFLNMMPRGLVVYNYQFFSEELVALILRIVPDWTAISTSIALIISESTYLLFNALLTQIFTSKVLSFRVTNVKF